MYSSFVLNTYRIIEFWELAPPALPRGSDSTGCPAAQILLKICSFKFQSHWASSGVSPHLKTVDTLDFSEVRRMVPRGRCREAHGMTARALIYNIESPVYTPHLRPFSRILPSSFISFPPRRASGAALQILRFRYCSLAAGIWHATCIRILL